MRLSDKARASPPLSENRAKKASAFHVRIIMGTFIDCAEVDDSVLPRFSRLGREIQHLVKNKSR